MEVSGVVAAWGRSGTYGINLSKHIRSGWENFSRSVRFEVGNGINIFFWHELWCRDVVLKGGISRFV